MPFARPEAVDLLMRVDADSLQSGDFTRWTIEGQPLTDEERKLADSITQDDLRAAADLFQARSETDMAEVDLMRRAAALIKKYGTKNLGEIPPETLWRESPVLYRKVYGEGRPER